jgi:phosphoglycerol transferase MdoB-like AlkP superfamily enzyme
MSVVVVDLLFIIACAALLLGLLGLLRLLLLATNRELATTIPAAALGRSFLIGIRFDMIVVGALLLAPILSEFWPGGAGARKFVLGWLGLGGALIIFLEVLELEFYRQFHTRLNSLVVDYLKEDPKTVTSMVWHGCPVLRYIFLWLMLTLLLGAGLLALEQLIPPSAKTDNLWLLRPLIFLPLLAAALIACRGTLRQGPPLRWGDAFFSSHLFANHLALNGVFTLAKALGDSRRQKHRQHWLGFLPPDEARERTRNLLAQPGDKFLDDPEKPILREQHPLPVTRPFRNLVVILMESFSATFTGALGTDAGITPAFDRLAADGILFDHFFSNGTHTHQGAFATLTGFPNLPGFETLMQQPQGGAAFSGLANHLKGRGFEDIYIYNGDFAWDNQEGFFRNQGMSRFIGRFDYDDPEFIDPTWGVSDHDMFNRAKVELGKLATAEKPFFAVLQTLSNHLPFTIPAPLPVSQINGHGRLDGHLTAMHYADWALGEFFTAIENQKWFGETLFVLLGDHSFCIPQQVTEIELLRFHVPLLFYAPGLNLVGQYGSRRSTVATQVDVVPTIMGLTGKPFVHQGWGRNLFNLANDDPGFGLIKPSGSDPTIALLQGDSILVQPPAGGTSRLYHYQLHPEATASPLDDPTRRHELNLNASAYIQTAMSSLLANQAGI